MTTPNSIETIYRGFDALDVSYQAQVPTELFKVLEQAKQKAGNQKHNVLVEHNGVRMHVRPNGVSGGYSYSVDTGPLGGNFFFKKPNPNDPWGVRLSVSSLCLATFGLSGTRAAIENTLKSLGIEIADGVESMSRIDFCIDFLIPDFIIEPKNFVMHSHMKQKNHHSDVGRSGRCESSTIGALPGMQVIIYDKTADIMAKRKNVWWTIWNTYRAADGRTPLERDNCKKAIWRVELRAGKRYLKDRWNLVTWENLDQMAASLFIAISQQVRLCSPSADTNRSRWSNSKLWNQVQQELSGALPTTSALDPTSIKEVLREKQEQLLWDMKLGLAASWSSTHGFKPHEAEPALQFLSSLYDDMCEEDIEKFERKMARADEKYIFTARAD